uniref:uncharacterized protein LOC131112030 n=1 Tax=Doryrhamphus excisus TaxID=161450 RepID=UPI0025ADCB02|nr:uncharacterized protein LOC131112030 [Doryrhamphus excisus]XP_057920130.1 uncharacterized protein LOC131112030 [Doryrhamphus excisus]
MTTCGLLHREINKAMHARALEYINHMIDLEAKFKHTLCCRLEQVRLFCNNHCQSVINPDKFFSYEYLRGLLMKEPMLIPYVATADGRTLRTMITGVLRHLTDLLKTTYDMSHNQASFQHSWQAYQAELVLEEIIYGRCLSTHDRQLSVSLGTSSSHIKSLTRLRGFLCLAPWNAATSEVCCPPLENWTRDPRNHQRIQRIFKLCDSLKAADSVVGQELWMVLLGDLLQNTPKNIPLADLKAVDCPVLYRVAGAQQSQTFIQMLVDNRAFPFPGTFDKAKDLVVKSGKDPLQCLQLGLDELKLRWFPHVRLWQSKHPRASWDRKSLVELYNDLRDTRLVTRVALVQGQVAQEMERRGLCFARTLDRYREHGMPWLEKCMARVPTNIDTGDKLRLLTCLTCIALLENNDYVSYRELEALLRSLTVTSARMQELLLLSKFILPKGTPFKLWHLHETIPTRLPPKPTTAKANPNKRPREENKEDEEDIQDVQLVEDTSEEEEVTKHRVRYFPGGSNTRWSSAEMSFISLNPDDTNKTAYRKYLKICEEKLMPARTLLAFSRKRKRMQEDANVALL